MSLDWKNQYCWQWFVGTQKCWHVRTSDPYLSYYLITFMLPLPPALLPEPLTTPATSAALDPQKHRMQDHCPSGSSHPILTLLPKPCPASGAEVSAEALRITQAAEVGASRPPTWRVAEKNS